MAAEDAAAPVPPASPFAQVLENIRNLSQRQKIAAGAALAFAIALVVGVILWSRQPDYAVLFSNLEEKDGGAVVASLQQQNVPYKFSDNGNAILVPTNQVHDLRLRMAAQGIPKGGLVGFELMENQKLGISQFHEQVNFQRALEGELSRTISAIASVAGARVHLAIPKQTAFLRDEQKPTASVMVNLHTGRALDPTQLAGIVHLIASSVPQLTNDNVSVIDQNGNLLTKKPDPLRANGALDASQILYTRELEEGFIERVNAILTPLFGKGNFRAQVSADVDFNITEQTAETYRPNPSPEQAIRSQQSSESQTRDQGPQGVPGALTNQPPVPATAPVTTPPVAGAAGPGQQPPLTTSKNATINYEVDKTVQHTRKALGQVRRLSVAVAVNQREEKDKSGALKPVPLDEEERQRIEKLVGDAVGYNKERGDTISVASSPFVASAEPETPLWKDPENQALIKELIKYLVIAGVIAFVAFGVIRPLLKQVMPQPEPKEEEAEAEATAAREGEETEEGEEGEEGEGAEVELSPEAAARLAYEEKLAKVLELARHNPKVLGNLIKEWMGSNEQQR